jgi:transcriptional regulator with PAS, ATPase and Fis domain
MLERRAPADNQALDQLTLEDAEELLIRQALARCENNVQAAAEQLGVSRSALYRRMEKYGT